MERDEKKTIRTLPGAVRYIHEIDPETAVTEYAIRKAIRDEQIRYQRIGRKYYLTVESIEDFYQGGGN